MNVTDRIKLHYPLPVAKLYESMRLEGEARQRVRKLVDLFERTSQYLVLVGLAGYLQQGLSDDKVEELRSGLARPSLGHWVELLKAISRSLRPTDPAFLTADPGYTYKDEPIGVVPQILAQVAGLQPPKRVMLHHFLDTMVEFRNKKIGHGSLSLFEANQVAQPLEAALTQWLEGLSTLYERHLLHIAKVEWDGHFVYIGTNLNTGTSLDPFRLEGDTPIDKDRVYLYRPAGQDLLPLYPFFVYNTDTNVLYAYSELSAQDQPVLKCPYHAPGAVSSLSLNIDKSLVVGTSLPPEPPDSQPGAEGDQAEAETIDSTKDGLFMRNWFDIIRPHADIRKGHFDEAVFAADLGDVAAGKAPADYNDPDLFFKKTYLTGGLTSLLTRVHQKLTTGQGPSVVQIQTPFGGGKTHSLVTIYHYLKHSDRLKESLPASLPPSPFGATGGRAGGEGRIAVVTGNHWDPLAGRTGDGLTRRTFWGDVAFQIGGQAGYEIFRENDEKRVAPGKDKLRSFLEAHQPFILLFDEVLEYINRAFDVRDKLEGSLGTQTFSFFQELTEAVSTLPCGMLVVTLPSSKLEDFGEREEEALARLGKIFGRLESIETPVRGEEIYAVIRRRLFEVEQIRTREMREVVHRYFQLYQQHREDLPPKARDVNYKDKLEMAYPFHPDLIDILIEKWSTFSSFQRTRGVLRLLANIVEDLYQREINIDMILPGDINLEKPGVRQEFLKHTGSEYEGVIASDIAGHEAKSQSLDAANRPWKHLAQRIASAVFCHSFSADDSEKGISLPYIKLGVLRSDTIPSLVTEVLQKLSHELWYLNSRADAFYFSRIPNLNRMILDKKELFNTAYEPELRAIIDKEIGGKFTPYLWPESGEVIPDNRNLKLVILRPEDSGSQIPAWIERRGNSFREYQNTLFFALADTAAFAKIREDVKAYLALQEIKDIVKKDPKSPLATKQEEIDRRMRDIRRDYSYNVRRMYHTLQVGSRRLDLGQPTAGSEDMGTWYWRELTDGNVGAIVEQLGYRILVNKLLAGNDQVAASIILDQFYKNTDLPVPAQPEVVARAIQLGIQDKALGLAEKRGDDLDPLTLKYGPGIMLSDVTFEPGLYVISQRKAEELLARLPKEDEGQVETGQAGTGASEGVTVTVDGLGTGGPGVGGTTLPGTTTAGEQKYRRVRLVIEGIPAGKIADVNRGILLPLSSLVKDLKFTLEIDVTSDEGISQAALENKIKETIRQIGARMREERVE